MSQRTSIATALLLTAFLLACSGSSRLAKPDYTYLYNPNQRLIKPEAKIFHHGKDSSQLYFRLNPKNLLYGKFQNDEQLTSRVLLKYRIFDYQDEKQLVDSATVALIDRGTSEKSSYLQARVNVKMPLGKLYRMKVYFRDEHKDLNTVYQYLFDKRLNGNAEFYLIRQEGKVVFNSICPKQKPITLFKSELIDCNSFELDSIEHDFKMTPPPFIEEVNPEKLVFSFREEVQFEDSLQLSGLATVNRLIPKDSGLLRLHFFHFHNGYPKITELEHMIDPIRYISTTSEYKNIKNALNVKKEIDDFWLRLGDDEATARAMIREYYTRVEIANRFFTTYREGWKTDRGIILIVYGQPTTIYKELNRESWIYGEENNILSVKFTFNKVRSEESDNIFLLERNQDYKSNWYRSVDDWRQGRIKSS